MKNGTRVWVALLASAASALWFTPAANAAARAKTAATPKAAASPATAAAGAAPASPSTSDLTGTWQGKLQAAPNTALTIRFIFARKPDGTYTATLTSPDNGAIKDVAASGVAVNNGTLSLQVPSLSGSYSGTFKGTNSIEGRWSQPGATLPLVLTPYQKPQMTKADMATLLGAWAGPLKLPGGSLTFVARFSASPKGDLQGTLAVPEQGGAEIPMADIEFAANQLSFKIPQVRGEFTGTYANGGIDGQYSQGGSNGLHVALKKGNYAAAAIVLKLTEQQFSALEGNWEGKVEFTTAQGQHISQPLVLDIVTDGPGNYVGFIENPAAHLKVPVTEATLSGKRLHLRVTGLQAEYDADLSGNQLTGQWAQGPGKIPLTLTRK